MTWLMLLSLMISLGKGVLSFINPGASTALKELYDEISAAVASLTAAHAKAVTLAELESLRTKVLW